MRLVYGVVIFAIISLSLFMFLSHTTEWPMEVIVITSLFAGGVSEWLFFKWKNDK
ncbi:hypothetical protein [Salipaludibacillus keqinensis]|jgi:hypothetical protein|uniref:hypothetical protein n=1 Tax=Salipaludibacillus keqinensis TaxID=2045207 RepID=UPI001304D269|nr:hypothetical protein [Salipaludibacillus keqinensis]